MGQIFFFRGKKIYCGYAAPPGLLCIIDAIGPNAKTGCSMNQKRQCRDLADELKNDAVKLVTEQGYSCTEVSRRLGVNHTNISRWVRDYRDQLEPPLQNPGSHRETEDEIKRLRKENKRLLMECEILKSAFLAKESNCDLILSVIK
jgi:transposase